MKTKSFKNLLRTWIAVGSIAAFMGGWMVFSHSTTPVTASNSIDVTSQLAPLPTLAQLGSNSSSSTSLQPLALSPNANASVPRFRARGS